MPLLCGILLFDDFETLDAQGPIELLGVPPTQEHVSLVTVGEREGPIKSRQGVKTIVDFNLKNCPQLDVLLVPGGRGTRQLISNSTVLEWIASTYTNLKFLLSVCTGSALLAKAGLLDGKKATSNKLSWDWVVSQSPRVDWVKQARWVHDGNIITSAGVSAGMDMTLYFIAQEFGEPVAAEVAKYVEYNGQWKDANEDKWGV